MIRGLLVVSDLDSADCLHHQGTSSRGAHQWPGRKGIVVLLQRHSHSSCPRWGSLEDWGIGERGNFV